MPDTPVAAAPVSAPAPAATPVAPSTPVTTSVPDAPSTQTSPSVSTEVSTPTPESAPIVTESTSVPTPKGPEPQAADFGDDIEGFLKARNAWQNGEETEAKPEEKPVEEVKPEEVKAEDVKEDDEPKYLDEPEESVTPERLNALLEAKPELKALLESDGALKGQLFSMARTNAKAAPLLEIFPTVEAGKFANETANKFVGLRSSFAMADSPEAISGAFEKFADEFKIVDDKGSPVLDAEGNATYGEDFELLTTHIIDRYLGSEVADIEARLSANKYASEEAKDNDEIAMQAINYVKSLRNPEEVARPDLDGLSPEARKYIEDREKAIEEKEKELGIKGNEQKKRGRVVERQQHEQKYLGQLGASAGDRIGAYIKQKLDNGVYIPSWVLENKDSKTGVPLFAKAIFDEYSARIKEVADYQQKLANLQMLPPNDASLAQRLKYSNELLDAELPAIIDKHVRAVQNSARKDVEDRKAKRNAGRKDARVEPHSGSSITPQAMTPEQLYRQAEKNVATKFAGQYLSEAEKLEKTFAERNRLQTARS